MNFSVSTCSFYKNKIKKLLELPENYGVEVFSDFGSNDYWSRFMEALRRSGNRGSFSMHAPFTFVDLANSEDIQRDYDTIKYYFDTYHKFSAEFYVLHAYGTTLSGNPNYMQEARKRSVNRIAELQEICRANDVNLLVENTCDGVVPLFNQEQFLDIFRQIPSLGCLIDVGHAQLSGIDVSAVQRELGARVKAYHLHSNNGSADQHLRIREGIFDWENFCRDARRYTPDATGVIEYMLTDDVSLIAEDIAYLQRLLA